MTQLIKKIIFVVLVCTVRDVLLCKENSKFCSGMGDNYGYKDYKDNSQNFNCNKDSIVSKLNETNVSVTLPPEKKHKIERVSKRQYEIVNLIWRKTKIFLDLDVTTTSKEISALNNRLTTNPLQSNKPKFPNSISTPSCIEFYYSDKFGDQLQTKNNLSPKVKKEISDAKIKQNLHDRVVDSSKAKLLRRPIFTFHLNNRNLKETDVESENFYLDVNEPKHFQLNESNQLQTLVNTSEKISNKRIARNNNNNSQWLSIFFNDPLNKVDSPDTEETSSKSSTFYDRIKFFELYDNNTLATTSSDEVQRRQKVTFPSEFSNTTQAIKIRENYSIQRYAPRSLYNSESVLRTPISIANRKRNIVNNLKENFKSQLSETKHASEMTRRSVTRTGIPIVWAKYPFLSVYIYEPMSIFCDAAAINSYWLIAAGSCLSRHRKNSVANGRSAYISYCGDKWWEFNSIAYVRRTIVHPLYSRRDKVRRHHYNIGAVQVITSMINSCSGWAPISLVSHNFTINEKGFPATAIGWGLDRYSSRYSYFNLPRRPLVAYEGTIFPKSCPKRNDNEAQYEKELNNKNLYCLSLPYRGEKKDTAHGTLLLVQGKLIALALQKGKSQENEISVLYTGVWRLVPWIQDLTRNVTKEILPETWIPPLLQKV